VNYIEEKYMRLVWKHEVFFKSVEGIDRQRAYNVRIITWEITGDLRTNIVFRQFYICYINFPSTRDFATAISQLFFDYLQRKEAKDEWKKSEIKYCTTVESSISYSKQKTIKSSVYRKQFLISSKTLLKILYLQVFHKKNYCLGNIIGRHTEIDKFIIINNII